MFLLKWSVIVLMVIVVDVLWSLREWEGTGSKATLCSECLFMHFKSFPNIQMSATEPLNLTISFRKQTIELLHNQRPRDDGKRKRPSKI